ncbi:MAG TPA: alpha/beta hydrolase, partial [Pyrinomonadaceae bacterium]
MKVNLKVVALFILLALTLGQRIQSFPAQTTPLPIVGTWNSTLVIGPQSLRLVLRVTAGADGLKALLDSLDQPNGANIPIDAITFQNNVLHFEIKGLSIVYEGTMSSDGSEIVGTFTQGSPIALIFHKEGTAKSTATIKRGRVEMKPCANPNLTRDSLCGKYEVFENRATKTGRRIALNIVLLPATKQQHAPDPLFYLAGGPGGAATSYAPEKVIQNLRVNRDVVLVDQRGTGDSNPLNCPSAGSREDMRPYFEAPFPVERVRACKSELEKVADLTLYTTSIAMDDLDEVREALGYKLVNIYGGSYGSTTALVYLRQHGDYVRSVAIFGVAPPFAKIPLSFARGVQDSINRLFADCAADKACNEKYPDVATEFKKVMAQFDNGPVEVNATNVYTKQVQKVTVSRDAFVDGIRQLLYVPNAAAALPALIHIGASGDLGPLVATAFQVVAQIDSKIARGMQFSVICGEDAPFITEQDIKTTSANSFYGDARVRPTLKACEEWPKAKVAASFLDAVKSDKPVLLVSGALDPVTPPWLAQQVATTLANSKLVVIQNATHSSYECVENLIGDFIDKGT